jgi:hypothetical protein
MTMLRVILAIFASILLTSGTAFAQPAQSTPSGAGIEGKMCSGQVPGFDTGNQPRRVHVWFKLNQGKVQAWMEFFPMKDPSEAAPSPPGNAMSKGDTLVNYGGGWVGFTLPTGRTVFMVHPDSFDSSKGTVDGKTARMQPGEERKFVCASPS